MLNNIVSILGALIGLGSLVFTGLQWRKINRKILMLDNVGLAIEILPAWYASRMMQDQWQFGLVTCDGSLIAISTILAISDDGRWMDIELLTTEELPNLTHSNVVCAVAGDRRRASVQIDKIVAAYDIVTS